MRTAGNGARRDRREAEAATIRAPARIAAGALFFGGRRHEFAVRRAAHSYPHRLQSGCATRAAERTGSDSPVQKEFGSKRWGCLDAENARACLHARRHDAFPLHSGGADASRTAGLHARCLQDLQSRDPRPGSRSQLSAREHAPNQSDLSGRIATHPFPLGAGALDALQLTASARGTRVRRPAEDTTKSTDAAWQGIRSPAPG